MLQTFFSNLGSLLVNTLRGFGIFLLRMVPLKSNEHFRFRHFYMVFALALVILVNVMLDPRLGYIQQLPFGAGVFASLVSSLHVVFYVTLLYVSYKSILDFVDLEEAWNKAKEQPIAAAIFSLAVAFIIGCITAIIITVILA